MASFGATVLDRMMSEISRLRAISSLSTSITHDLCIEECNAYRLLPVAFSICSSRAVLADVDHQFIMLTLVSRRG